MSPLGTRERHGIYIHGEDVFVDGSRLLTVENPYDRIAWGEVTEARRAETDAAIASAEQARHLMRDMPAHRRTELLRNVARLIETHRDDLVSTVIREVGKPFRDASREVGRAAQLFDLAADYARGQYGETMPMDAYADGSRRWGMAVRVPVGIVAAVTPFNSPINLTSNKIAPALAAGNAVVCKPSSRTPISVLKLAHIVREAGFPPGAFNVVVGATDEVAAPLVRDPRVRMVTFTGGVQAGAAIAAGAGIKKLALELGSISANIVCADADVVVAAKALATSCYLSSGQACISAQRLIIEQGIYDAFVEKFVGYAEVMKIGDPSLQETEIGALAEETITRTLATMEEARAAGAKVLTGGRRVGNALAPIALADVPRTCRAFCEEAFGPVATLHVVPDMESAIALANDSPFGLQAGVFTRDLARAFAIARGLDVGGVWINDTSRFRVDVYPFGGMKLSGIGREGVKYAIEEMTELKFMGVNFG